MLDSPVQQLLGAEHSRIIAASRRCVAVPAFDGLTPGHLVVLPRRHVPSLCRLSAGELAELQDLAERVRGRLRRTYEMPVIALAKADPGVTHARVHLVPTLAGLVDWLASRQPRCWQITSLTGLPYRLPAFVLVGTDAGPWWLHHGGTDHQAGRTLQIRQLLTELDNCLTQPAPDADPQTWQHHRQRTAQETVADLDRDARYTAGDDRPLEPADSKAGHQ
ncbi:HIT family protein [Actinomadura rupiterrae]|uniref:HIT family protein n=1 Tax=Actinomadura rupiterrae TaxID=559627 RepID=UPI0020A57884|nr:HIT domain-containing protein [Actinomadura rupiterrae]MCP2338893.1 diadenosine tetraphosphate (Ap4A) HIT family hydrolase [Actinomadura rupiterrae]